MPLYNGENFIKKAVDSLLCQTYRDFEVIISDDCSTDRTFQIVKTCLGQDNRFRVHRNEKNIGMVPNWNRCIELSKGKYIKFLFQDDWFEPELLEKMVEVLDANPLVGIALSRQKHVNERGEFIKFIVPYKDDVIVESKKAFRELWIRGGGLGIHPPTMPTNSSAMKMGIIKLSKPE